MLKKKKVFDKRQINIFDFHKETEIPNIDWQLPDLRGAKSISLDTEGALNIWSGGKPCGLSIATEDSSYSWYVPFGHKSGFNFPLENVRGWASENLRNLDIYLANAKHDFNTLRSVGIDLEAGNNRLHDVMHCPALLYSNRQNYDLDSLLNQELGRSKASVWGGDDYVKLPMAERPSEFIAAYACADAVDTSDLARHYAPRIAAEGLGRVLELEDSIIYAVASMERQGARLDTERLFEWRRIAHARYIKAVMQLYKLVGARIEPTKPSHMAKLFTILQLEYPLTPTGQPSFTNEFIVACLQNPGISAEKRAVIQVAYEAIQLSSLESKALKKFENSVDSNGIIRYALNQLKATNTDGNVGAVTGRFSSSGGGKHINGVNIQQVMDDEKQEKIDCISMFPIRDLFIPEKGHQWLSADAMQIEFRLFAHYSGSQRLAKAYEDNPLINFHHYVAEHILKVPYSKLVKNMNFGKLYEIGVKKLAQVYLKCSYDEALEKSKHYDREFPEAKALSRAAMDIAQKRGYVKTILGRRRRYFHSEYFPNLADDRYYSALNAVIQGTAADIMKLKIKEVYDARKETGYMMNMTIHDEVNGSIPNLKSGQMVKEILNKQTLPLRVPILWTVSMGETWKRCQEI